MADVYPRIVTDASGAPWARKIEEIQKRHTEEIWRLRENYEKRLNNLTLQIQRLQRP